VTSSLDFLRRCDAVCARAAQPGCERCGRSFSRSFPYGPYRESYGNFTSAYVRTSAAFVGSFGSVGAAGMNLSWLYLRLSPNQVQVRA
jgi:hypothetical protein